MTCGDGQQVNTRSCDNPKPAYGGADCDGPYTETVTCSMGTCPPVDGNWGMWSIFTPCTATCGGGTKSRVRICNNPTPEHGGVDCVGKASETQTCNDNKCPG